MSVKMTKKEAQELAKRAIERGEKDGFPIKKKYDVPVESKKGKQKK